MNKNIFDLCFHTGQDLSVGDHFIKFKNKLEKRGISVMAFTLNEKLGRFWSERGMHDYIVLPVYEGMVDIKKAADFVKQLGISNFRSLYQTPQIFYDLDEDFCQKKMASYIYALQRLGDIPKAKVYWTYGGDEFDHNCLRLLSRINKGRTIYSQPSLMNNRMVIFENEDRYWEVPKSFLPLPTSDDIDSIKEYKNTYISNKTILWADPKTRDIRWEWSYPLRFVKRIRKSNLLKKTNPESTNKHKTKVFLNRALNRFISKKYYSDVKPFKTGNEKFVYFPLHYPKDSQLTLRGKPFLDQAAIVEIVARYLPYPYLLLVKEHPHARGWYKASDIKKMTSLPNVKLIHPFTNSHDLIPHAKAIIAINSSVGYESIIYKKPVITLGRSFYRNQGVTIDVESLYDLENAFERMEIFSISDQKLFMFLWQIIYFSYPTTNLFDKTNVGIDYLVAAIEDYLKRYI